MNGVSTTIGNNGEQSTIVEEPKMPPMTEVSVPPADTTAEPEENSGAPSSHPVVGIIYPPPEVRNIVDKTASFVARNGPEFESRICKNELGNPKFNFLNTGDPYHSYYQHKVKEFKEGKGQEPKAPTGVNITAAHLKQQEILKQVEQPFIPKDPPPEFEFIADPPSISALDLDIVKLTAQFVARNGRQFLTNLMNREQRNFQFDFLRPQHSLFQYFTRLLEQYTKVLIPPKNLIAKLRNESYNRDKIHSQVNYRAQWVKYQDAQKRKEEEELERDRIAYAQIDWHDFVVVETVDYQQFEVGNFPAPTTPDEVGARVLIQERIEDGQEVEMQIESDNDDEILPRIDGEKERARDNNQIEDMEEESSDEDEVAPPGESQKKDRSGGNMQPPPLPPTPGNVVVKKGYDPKQHAAKSSRPSAPDEYLVSPITGERIPASKVQEHMRITLLDPRWVEQRDKQLDKMTQETVFAPGTAIEASLKQLAERRTDIFGVGDEETAIGKKIGEEEKKKDDKVTWDGHTSSVEAATRAARANITLEEQIHQIHKFKGLLPDEEKEKIGPKPATSRAAELSHMAAVASKSQATLKAPPKPPAPKPVPQVQQQQPPPLPPQMGMPGMGMPQQLMPQPPMMMMAPMPPIRPPPPLLAPNMSPFMPTPPQMQPPMPPQMGMKHPADCMDDEPMAKKLRTEDSLIPEQQFLLRNKGPVQLNIATPMMTDKPEWKLNGQTLTIQLQVTDTVSAMKARIHEVTGMPPGKQKLQYEGMFFKDNNSLAYYNLTSGNMINLLPKERGGRKK